MVDNRPAEPDPAPSSPSSAKTEEPGEGLHAPAMRSLLSAGIIASPSETAPSPSTFYPLDPRVIHLWRITGLIEGGLVLLAWLGGAGVAWMKRPGWLPWIITGLPVILGMGAWLIYWRPPRLYRSWGYRIDAKVLETRSGLLFKVTRLLPLSRLQHVDLERGPLERAFSLASLALHTAGTHEATIVIPGLDAQEAVRLRDHLVRVGDDDAGR